MLRQHETPARKVAVNSISSARGSLKGKYSTCRLKNTNCLPEKLQRIQALMFVGAARVYLKGKYFTYRISTKTNNNKRNSASLFFATRLC